MNYSICFYFFILSFSLSKGYWLPFLDWEKQSLNKNNLFNENIEMKNLKLIDESTIKTGENEFLNVANSVTDSFMSQSDNDFNQTTEMFTESNNLFDEKVESNSKLPLNLSSTTYINDVIEEIQSETEHFTQDSTYFNAYEKIFLPRTNCHLEIAIDELQNINIQIDIEPLLNNSAGKCCITLNGPKESSLGILISNIYLYYNNFEGEILKVIVTNTGREFVLKQYYGKSEYHPLLLTETHRVYIVLYYNVTSVIKSNKRSHFNLEVFSYHKSKN